MALLAPWIGLLRLVLSHLDRTGHEEDRLAVSIMGLIPVWRRKGLSDLVQPKAVPSASPAGHVFCVICVLPSAGNSVAAPDPGSGRTYFLLLVGESSEQSPRLWHCDEYRG